MADEGGTGARRFNDATRHTAAILGAAVAVGGISHGTFAALQGNTPITGFLFDSIGPAQRFWPEGSDPAVTLIPNFLFTGLMAVIVSVALIVWCLRALDRPGGANVMLGGFVLLTAVGGGVGHIPFFIVNWAFGTRIHSALGGWDRLLRPPWRGALAALWPWALSGAALLFLLALAISVFGLGFLITDVDATLWTIWMALLVSLVLMPVAFAGAAARDLHARQPA